MSSVPLLFLFTDPSLIHGRRAGFPSPLSSSFFASPPLESSLRRLPSSSFLSPLPPAAAEGGREREGVRSVGALPFYGRGF